MLLFRCVNQLLFIVCVLLLTHCTKITDTSVVHINQQLVSPYTMPATAYLALAKNQTGSEKQSLMIMAAGRLIYDGQWREGLVILSETTELTPVLISEKRLLLAKVDLIRNEPHNAISKLSSVQDSNDLPIYYQVQFHEMLALAYQTVGNTTESVKERIKLERLLPDEASKANNRRALWLSLTKLPAAELDMLAMEAPTGSVFKGWLELSLIARKSSADPQSMLAAIEQWQRAYPDHPARFIFPSPLSKATAQLFARPKQMALLLPLTGPLAGPGGAIKDGFMAAFDASNTASHSTVRLYNTDGVDIAALYEQALNDGADYIVGPLSKTNVAVVAGMNHPVPTVLLNDTDTKPSERAYQFGLSPTYEARQVAARARKNGYSRALVIAPADAWGNDVASAFESQWRANGGLVVDTARYRPNDDLNNLVRDFLRVSDSEARSKQLKQLLGHSLESSPSRRQDVDMIFLLAYPSKARQIMPLLKYYYAGDIPVYATSSVYGGSSNAMKDRDLNGIIFCDMPWVFTHQMGSKNWPEQFNSYNRLYALGMDSYALTSQLNQLLLFPAMGVNDHSGVLYLTSSDKIARILAFGQFKQGLAQELADSH